MPAKTALVVVDMLNTYEHADAERAHALGPGASLPPIASPDRARRGRQDVEVIYVNDNFGVWNPGRSELVERRLGGRARRPVRADRARRRRRLFVVKARHSIFYETAARVPAAQRRRSSRLVLVGQVTEQCILYSALDAYIRHFEVVVPPRRASPRSTRELHEAALEMMRINMDADLTPAAEVRVRASRSTAEVRRQLNNPPLDSSAAARSDRAPRPRGRGSRTRCDGARSP